MYSYSFTYTRMSKCGCIHVFCLVLLPFLLIPFTSFPSSYSMLPRPPPAPTPQVTQITTEYVHFHS